MTNETLELVQIRKACVAEYMLLGVKTVRKGTTGWWVSSIGYNAHAVASVMGAVLGVPIEQALKRVRTVGVEAVGNWYHRVSHQKSGSEYRVAFYVTLARIAGADVELDNVKACADGEIRVRIDGDWTLVDNELIDACLVERDLSEMTAAQVAADPVHRLVDMVRGFIPPTMTPEERVEIAMRTNSADPNQMHECDEYLVVNPIDK